MQRLAIPSMPPVFPSNFTVLFQNVVTASLEPVL